MISWARFFRDTNNEPKYNAMDTQRKDSFIISVSFDITKFTNVKLIPLELLWIPDPKLCIRQE